MSGSVLVLRQAFENARNACDAGEFEFDEHCGGAAGTSTRQLWVTYKGGNEHLQLDRLLDALRNEGDIAVFELRGRGRDEAPKLVIDFEHDGETSQLIYCLT